MCTHIYSNCLYILSWAHICVHYVTCLLFLVLVINDSFQSDSTHPEWMGLEDKATLSRFSVPQLRRYESLSFSLESVETWNQTKNLLLDIYLLIIVEGRNTNQNNILSKRMKTLRVDREVLSHRQPDFSTYQPGFNSFTDETQCLNSCRPFTPDIKASVTFKLNSLFVSSNHV